MVGHRHLDAHGDGCDKSRRNHHARNHQDDDRQVAELAPAVGFSDAEQLGLSRSHLVHLVDRELEGQGEEGEKQNVVEQCDTH